MGVSLYPVAMVRCQSGHYVFFYATCPFDRLAFPVNCLFPVTPGKNDPHIRVLAVFRGSG